MATITKNKYLLLFFVLLTILTKANCADKASLSQQLIITPGLHHKRIVDIRLSYENPRKNYLLSYEDIEGNYKISLKLFIERWNSKNVISEDTLCNPKVFSGEIKRELSDIITEDFYTNFLWDTTSFYILRSSDSLIVSICQGVRELAQSDDFKSVYIFKFYNINNNEVKDIEINIPTIVLSPLDYSDDIVHFLQVNERYFYNGLFSLLLGRLYDAYFFFGRSWSEALYYKSEVKDDYFIKVSLLTNINNLALHLNEKKFTYFNDSIKHSILNKTGYQYSKTPYLPSVDSLYTIKRISYNKKGKYYTITAKSNYGRTYRIISHDRDNEKEKINSVESDINILKVGKQYKLALKSIFVLYNGGPFWSRHCIIVLPLGDKMIKLFPNSNYFFAYNLVDGINYEEIP